jgi:uncharacterized membrane protein YbhN (UPF0104 family)
VTSQNRSTYLKHGIRCGIAAGLLLWLYQTDRLSGFSILSDSWNRFLPMAIAFQLGVFVFPIWRFHCLMHAVDMEPPLLESFHVAATGYFFSLVIPALLGVDTVRVAHFCKRFPEKRIEIIVISFADRLFGVFGLVFLAAICGAFFVANVESTGNEVIGRTVVWVVAFGLLSCIAVLLLYFAARQFRHAKLQYLEDACKLCFRQPKALVACALLTICGHLSGCLAAVFTFQSLSVIAPLGSVFAVIPLVNLTRAIPITPMALGVADSAASALFDSVSVPRGADMTMLLRATTVLISVACGFATLFPIRTLAEGAESVRPHR